MKQRENTHGSTLRILVSPDTGWGLIALVLLLVAVPAVAQEPGDQPNLLPRRPMCHPQVPPPGILPPPPQHYCTECKCSASPCYVSNGNYFTTNVDLRVSSPSGPLAIIRRYDSAIPVNGPPGVGWSATVAVRLYYATYLITPPSTFQKRAYIVLEDGTRLAFTENVNGTSYTPLSGRYDTLLKNGDSSFDLTLQQSRRRYHFSATGALQARYDDSGNVQTFTYDGNGKLQQIADGAGSGRYLNVFYGGDGRVSDVQDSGGRAIHYTYNADGTLATFEDAEGRVDTYSYADTSLGRLLSGVTDHWGRMTTSIGYDGSARVQTLTANGETDTFAYNAEGPNSTEKYPAGVGFRYYYAYDANGLVTDRTRVYSVLTGHGGPTVHTDFYADGSIQQTTDELGVKTYYTYDSMGRQTTVTRDYQGPTAVRFDYAYHPTFADRVISITPRKPSDGSVNLDWQAWRYDYYPGSPSPGALHHVYRVRNDGTTLDTLSTYEYNTRGQVTKVTSPTGGVTDYTYDGTWNLWKVTGPSNNDGGTRPVTTYGYDLLGRVTSVQNALGKTTSYTYDAVDRVTSVTLPKPTSGSSLNFTTSYSYDNDANGLLYTHITDPNGLITKQGYDQWGRLVESADAQNHLTTYEYAENGTLTSITDANGNVTTYEYDGLAGWLTYVWLNGTNTEGYTYYLDGTLEIYYSRDGWRRNYYDHLKRVTRRDNDVRSLVFTYLGQKLTDVEESNYGFVQAHELAYDTSYRLQTLTQGTQGTITYGYNLADGIASYAVSGGPTATYAYYPDRSLNTINWTPVAGQFKYRYALAGQYQSLTYPNGGTRNYTYDDQGRLTQLTNLDPVTGNLATYGYGYDFNYTTGLNTMLGQRSSATATVPSLSLNNHLFKYEYDSLYQQKKVTYPNVAPFSGEIDSWTYDPIGNRLTNTVNGVTQTYTYLQSAGHQSQRLSSDGINTYTYPYGGPSGSIATRYGPGGNFNFTWNNWGELTRIDSTSTSLYTYDYQGRRFKKDVSGTVTTYLYEGLNLIREVQGATTTEYLFGPGIDEPIALNRGGQTYYYGVDGLGSVVTVANSSGAVQNKYLYDAWGNVRNTPTSFANPFTYTARETGEAGLMFYRARYYQPSMGRFLSEDPLWGQLVRMAPLVLDRSDMYRYAGSSPIDGRDPLGLKRCGPASDCVVPCVGCCLDRLRKAICSLRDVKSAKRLISIAEGVGGMAKAGIRGGAAAVDAKCLAVEAQATTRDAREALIGTMGVDAALLLAGADCFKTCDNFPCYDFPNSPCPFLGRLLDLAKRNADL